MLVASGVSIALQLDPWPRYTSPPEKFQSRIPRDVDSTTDPKTESLLMSIYDVLMLIVLGGAIFIGWWKGIAWQVASIVSIALSYFVALNFRGTVAPMISVEEPWNKAIAMFLLFIGTALAVWILFGFIRTTIEKMQLKSWDRQAGALLGAIKGGLLCMVITLFGVTILGEANKRAIINSHSGRMITKGINRLAVAVPEELRVKIDGYLNDFNDEVDKHHDPNVTSPPIQFPNMAGGENSGSTFGFGNQHNHEYQGTVTTGGSPNNGGIYYDGSVQIGSGSNVSYPNNTNSNSNNGSIINWEGVGDRVLEAARDSLDGNRQ